MSSARPLRCDAGELGAAGDRKGPQRPRRRRSRAIAGGVPRVRALMGSALLVPSIVVTELSKTLGQPPLPALARVVEGCGDPVVRGAHMPCGQSIACSDAILAAAL